MNYTYILKCNDDTFYIGWTNNLEHRIKAHNRGEGAKYTKIRRPVYITYFEEYEDKKDAMKREYALKKITRSKKIELVTGFKNCEMDRINKDIKNKKF